jgi:hypothetical protein
MAVPPVRKISETIIDFGEPLFQQFLADEPYEGIRSTFEIVILIWNAHVMAMPRWGQPRFLADLQTRAEDPQMPVQFAKAFELLSQRFASDARAVGEWSVVQQSGQWRLRCDARAPDAAV